MPYVLAENLVLDTLAAMTAKALARCGLDDNSLIAARIGGLASVDAPVTSYLLHVAPPMDLGVAIEQVPDISAALAPIIGAPRTLSAAARTSTALGVVIIVLGRSVGQKTTRGRRTDRAVRVMERAPK